MADTNTKTKYYCVDVKDNNGVYQPLGIFPVIEALKLPWILGRACRLESLGTY